MRFIITDCNYPSSSKTKKKELTIYLLLSRWENSKSSQEKCSRGQNHVPHIFFFFFFWNIKLWRNWSSNPPTAKQSNQSAINPMNNRKLSFQSHSVLTQSIGPTPMTNQIPILLPCSSFTIFISAPTKQLFPLLFCFPKTQIVISIWVFFSPLLVCF